MMYFKKIYLLFFISIQCFSSDINLYFKNTPITNAQTALLILEAKDIKEPKLTLKTKKPLNIDFIKNNKKENQYYALVPISYYEKIDTYKVIISYLIQNKKKFKSIQLQMKNNNYKSEVINVSKSKFKPSKDRVKRTQEEYKNAIKIYNSKSRDIYWKDDFIYPMNSKITSNFGTKRVYNGQVKSYHSGTDYRAKIGTAIIAVNSGIIRISSNRFYAGNSIVIDHGQGIYSCYFHLSKMNFNVGDFVKKGEIIGLSGDTGRITGPHLHFAFRVNGIQVDPLQLIKTLNLLKNN